MTRFRLEPVLKLRRHREEARKRELAEAVAAENERKDAALRYAQMRQEQTQAMRRQGGSGQLDMRSLIDYRVYLGRLDREIRDQLRSVAVAEKKTAERREHLTRAMVDRKAIDKLARRHAERQRLEQDRRETAELDEMALRLWRGEDVDDTDTRREGSR